MAKKETYKFVFEVIVTHFETNKVQIDSPKSLIIIVRFNNLPVEITSSRINVTDFKPGSGVEFHSTARHLRKTLAQTGIPFSARYNNKLIGNGEIRLPAQFTERIDDEMGDLTHSATCELFDKTELVGALEFLFRLYVKCEEQTRDEQTECQSNPNNSINPRDIMFVMGEKYECPKNCDMCPDVLDPEEGDERLELDLQRYRSSNVARRRPSDHLMHSPNATCAIKNMARECEQIVDSIFGQTQHFKSPCRRKAEKPDPLLNTDATFPSFSYSPTPQYTEIDHYNPQQMPVPITDLKNPPIKPIRFCPVCLTNMSWLPKFAACPNCGVKPTPIIEERHKEKKLTADQILNDFLGKQPMKINDCCANPSAEVTRDDHRGGCRCTCKGGKICAHCRIRQLCVDIFQGDDNALACPEVKPQPSEDFFVVEKNLTECRPHLARVFSELKDLYDIKEMHKREKLCSKKNSTKRNQSKSSYIKTTPKPSIDSKISVKEKINQNYSKPINETRRTTSKARHKSCSNQQGAVPRRHGWNWTDSKEAQLHGWRPGFIRKPILKLMKFFLHSLPASTARSECEQVEAAKKKEQKPPILNVCKKNGEIFITLRAVNDPNAQMKPITFRIVKSDLAVALRKIKRKLKDKGYPKCTCHNTVMMCTCRNNREKRQLEYAVQKECKRLRMESCVDQLILTDTSESEMEYDFNVTPPAGTTKPVKRRTSNIGTQTGRKETIVTPKYPSKISPYWRAYNCATGDQYTGTAFGAPGEKVFEDGLFGYRGGGPHGAYSTLGGRPKNTRVWGDCCGGPMHGGGRDGYKGRPGGKSFPKLRHAGDSNSKPIPVRLTNRIIQSRANAAQIARDTAKKKVALNMMKYIKKHGAFAKTKVGPDGLTNAQRKRRALRQGPMPPIEFMPRLGRGSDPCGDLSYYPCDDFSSYYC